MYVDQRIAPNRAPIQRDEDVPGLKEAFPPPNLGPKQAFLPIYTEIEHMIMSLRCY